jgi:hypothetical protein
MKSTSTHYKENAEIFSGNAVGTYSYYGYLMG